MSEVKKKHDKQLRIYSRYLIPVGKKYKKKKNVRKRAIMKAEKKKRSSRFH